MGFSVVFGGILVVFGDVSVCFFFWGGGGL